MLAVESTLDWGAIIAAVVPGIFSLASMIIAAYIHRQIKTPSGDPIGHVVERAHETGIANNLLLGHLAGQTKPANGAELHQAGQSPPAVPADEPAAG